MKKNGVLAENAITKLFLAMAVILFFGLCYYSLFYSYIEVDYFEEELEVFRDNWIANTSFLVVIICLAAFLFLAQERITDKACNILLAVTMISMMAVGLYWISCHAWEPQADQSSINLVAHMVSQNDYCSFASRWGYGATFQHQWGLILLLEIIYRILPNADYRVFIYLNWCMVPVITYSGYYICKKISSGSKAVKIMYLIAIVLCVPLYGYIPYVYGEMISIALIIASAALLFSILDEFSAWKVIVFSVMTGISVQIRQTALIYVVALLIVLIVLLVCRIDWKVLLLLGVSVISLWGCHMIVRNRYEPYLPEECDALPLSVTIAMGLHDTPDGPGWCDGSNAAVFAWESDGDAEVATEIAKADIVNRIQVFKENPTFAMDFFRRKITSQWNAPMYQAFGMNHNNIQEAEGLVPVLYYGTGKTLVEGFMNIYQLLTYVGVLSFLIFGLKRGMKFVHCLSLIIIFGGFLFSIIYEAKARYILPYFILMIPYAVAGIELIVIRGIAMMGEIRRKQQQKNS